MKNSPIPFSMKLKIRLVLEQCWSAKTSCCFNPKIAPLSYGQCAPTAVVLHEIFGGEILKTEVRNMTGSLIQHFYNCIGGERVDFTADQFDIPKYWGELVYLDVPSSLDEACAEMLDGQLESMRHAFRLLWEDASHISDIGSVGGN